MSALRTAGRGSALRQPTAPTTRLPSQFPPRSANMGRGDGRAESQSKAPSTGAGRGSLDLGLERSALSRAVLRRRENTNRHGQDRKRGVVDWFASQERMEALEQLKISRGVGGMDVPAMRGVPFGWRNFDEGLRELPADHWASPFVREVVRSVEMNPELAGSVKEEILDRTLTELSRLSVRDERFQDAEE
eukprot:GFKZ01007751.1.p1 GENE.GFKZ01007751.1~~GFKZ01007751.1.p1  ORF type:complete len:219 (-),score=26.86 GFKZ01007751.1:1043-1612(-)